MDSIRNETIVGAACLFIGWIANSAWTFTRRYQVAWDLYFRIGNLAEPADSAAVFLREWDLIKQRFEDQRSLVAAEKASMQKLRLALNRHST